MKYYYNLKLLSIHTLFIYTVIYIYMFNYSCNGKAKFSTAITPVSLTSVSLDLSEIFLYADLGAQGSFFIIISVETDTFFQDFLSD